MIYESTLKGYILEELLARLVKQSGYSLLVDSSQDTWSLDNGGNGLRVHGRGADHQADVLGELDVPVHLHHPIRVFLEAKCRVDKSDLRDVRNAVGTIDDVNQYYTMKDASSTPPPRRYQYKYALASTSGFTKEAVYYAVTHQLTLVDLSGSAVTWLRDMVDRIAKALLLLARKSGLKKFPVVQMREAMRRALGTHPDTPVDIEAEDSLVRPASRAETAGQPASGLNVRQLAHICADVAAELQHRFFIAWTASPFLVFVQPNDEELASSALMNAPTDERRWVRGRLDLVGPTPQDGRWTLSPLTSVTAGEDFAHRRRSNGAALNLLVPPELEPFLIATDRTWSPVSRRSDQSAFNVQIAPQSTVEIRYEPIAEPDDPTGNDDDPFIQPWDLVRERNWVEGSNLDDETLGADTGSRVLWSEDAYHTLIARLGAEGAVQATVIESAALDDGTITRASVYLLADRDKDKTLRGFTKPALRIARDLVADGLLHPDAAPPLVARYRHGVKASHFVVPQEFTDYVDPGLHYS